MTNFEPRTADDERFQSRVRWSNIPAITYKTHRLQTFLPRKGAEEAYQAALDFVSGKAKHHFLTFVGEPGCGKTHLALGIGWHFLENERGLVKYYQAEALLDDLRRGYNESDPERLYTFDQLLKWLKTCDLLVIDDLGVEKPTEWSATKLDLIIDYRYLNQSKTVFTTNLTPSALASRGEQRLASRLREGAVETLKCSDYRKIKAQMGGRGR